MINEEKNKNKSPLNITVLSLTCCNPKFKAYDDQYVSRIKEALSSLHLEAKVEVVSVTDAVFGLKVVNPQKIWDLLDKYGTAVAPVLFINGEVTLYGGIPKTERLVDAISKVIKTTPQQSDHPSDGATVKSNKDD